MPPTRTPSGALKIKGLGGRSHWLLQEVDQHTQPSGFIDITVEILGRYHMMVKDSLVTVLFVADYTPMKIPTPNLSGRFPRKLQPYVYRIECEKSALPSANSIKIGSICTITNNRIVLRDFYGTGLGGRQHDPIAKEHTLKWKAQPGELHTDRRVAKLIRRRTDLGPVMTPISDVEEGSVVSFTAQVMYVISDRDSTSLYVTDYTLNSHLLRGEILARLVNPQLINLDKMVVRIRLDSDQIQVCPSSMFDRFRIYRFWQIRFRTVLAVDGIMGEACGEMPRIFLEHPASESSKAITRRRGEVPGGVICEDN